MNRVRGIGALSMNLMTVSMINEAARVEAIFNKKLHPDDPRVRYGNPRFDPVLFSEIDEERKRLIDKWIKSHPRKEDFEASVAMAATWNGRS
jgi:hypothetical protein